MSDVVDFPSHSLSRDPGGTVAMRKSFDQLDRVGIDPIREKIEEGYSMTEIANMLGVPVSHLMRWASFDHERAHSMSVSVENSAEMWMDRGLKYLLDASPDPVELARAKELAAHCRRMAAIRNAAFRDGSLGHRPVPANDGITDSNKNEIARRVAFILQKGIKPPEAPAA